jgi:hypothetical protein
MFFEITEHFFDPHPTSVTGQGHATIGQIGCQAPGLFLTAIPMRQQVHRVDLTLCQVALVQPNALTRLLNKTAEILPTLQFIHPYMRNCFLTQNVKPLPGIQLTQDFHRSKFGIANQKHRRSFRKQFANIGQQSQLLSSSTMPANMFGPCPGNWNGTLPIGQADDQQLMSKSNLCSIENQTDLSKAPKLAFQPLPGNRLILCSYSNGRIIQQSA